MIDSCKTKILDNLVACELENEGPLIIHTAANGWVLHSTRLRTPYLTTPCSTLAGYSAKEVPPVCMSTEVIWWDQSLV
jgi:hypothetical protein